MSRSSLPHDGELIPRPHQRAASQAILAARATGRRGFLLGDATGLGKTLAVWSAVAAMPEADVLIVCPKGGLPQWRRTIALAGAVGKTVTLINYERTKALMALSSASGRRSTRAKNNELAKRGTPKRSWPLVVFDESHRLRNPYAQQSLVCRRLADAATFAIYMSATAGQAPHELSYLGRLLGEAADVPTETLAGFRDLMKGLGIGRAKGRWTNWSWTANARDCTVIADLLYRGERAIGLLRRPADIAGWPEIQRELAPTALGRDERRLYEATWREFRRAFGLAGGSTRRPAGWAAALRFRQKASLLRVIHDMRHSAIQLAQVEGRCHRDGQQATVYYAFAEGTVEEAVTATVVRRMASMEAMAGEDASLLDAIAAVVEQAATGQVEAAVPV